MSLEMAIPKAKIRQLAGVISPANPDDSEFGRRALDYMRLERDHMRVMRSAGRTDSDAPIDDELRQLRGLRRRVEALTNGTTDGVQGGAEVVKGRVRVLAGRLGARAPWWLSLLRIQPTAQHPLISPIQSRERDLRDQRIGIRQVAADSSLVSIESRRKIAQAAEEFLNFCDGIAASQSEKVATAYLNIRPERIPQVTELFAQNHGLEEEYLRFLPKYIRELQRSSDDTRWFQRVFGVLWSQLRADDPSQLGTEARKLWLGYLAKNILTPDWSKLTTGQG